MEIIHVILGKANPERMNGVNKVVYQLATKQAAAGRRVAVWGITKDVTPNFPKRNFETRLFKSYRNKFRLDNHLISAIRANSGSKVIYHLHGGFNPVLYSVAMELVRQQQPYVFTPHGAYNIIAMKKSPVRKKIYFNLFEKRMLKGANAIHSLGASEIDGLQTVYPNDKSQLIPYGFEPAVATVHQIETGKFIVGYCGRIDIYTKGLDLLVQAFARLNEKMPHAELWIIGGGQEEEKLHDLVKQQPHSEKIRLFGSLFGEQKDKVMSRFSVFAHPSRNEGLPTAVLEAAAMSIPCVVTTATNTAEVIANYSAGETIDSPEADKLFHALMTMGIKQVAGGLDETGRNARQMVEEVFNWNTIIHRFDNLYYTAC